MRRAPILVYLFNHDIDRQSIQECHRRKDRTLVVFKRSGLEDSTLARPHFLVSQIEYIVQLSTRFPSRRVRMQPRPYVNGYDSSIGVAGGDYNIVIPMDIPQGLYKIRVSPFEVPDVYGCSGEFLIVSDVEYVDDMSYEFSFDMS